MQSEFQYMNDAKEALSFKKDHFRISIVNDLYDINLYVFHLRVF